jgi:hypothetical protein
VVLRPNTPCMKMSRQRCREHDSSHKQRQLP